MNKLSLRLAVLLTGTAVALVTASVPASAAPFSNAEPAVKNSVSGAADAGARKTLVPDSVGIMAVRQTFRNQQSNNYMRTGGSGTVMWGITGPSSTPWDVHVWADNTRQLKNVYNQHCIEGRGPSGARAYLIDCAATERESWYILRWNDGTISFKNQQSGLCMTDEGGNVIMRGCIASRAQSWF